MRLAEKIRQINRDGLGVHMPHVYVGDPCIGFTGKLLEVLAKNGGDIIEVGIPFSDPVADGPTFQSVCQRALDNGITPSNCLDLVKNFREKGYDNPVILTTYYNIPYNMGLQEFSRRASDAGVQGVIIPNMPVEEAESFIEAAREHGVDVIFQVAPTTTEERLKKVADVAAGFLYVINVQGVTGERDTIHQSTVNLIRRVKEHIDLPVLAGFGVSTARHARVLMEAGANGVIAGSVYANVYQSYSDPLDSIASIRDKVRDIKSGCIL